MEFDGSKLRDLLQREGIRQCEFARACDQMPPSTLSAILRGWMPVGERTLFRLHRGLVALGIKKLDRETVLKVTGPIQMPLFDKEGRPCLKKQ